ncbi:hypothetical protein C5167_011919 [Papaver somniferum]|uniref:Uncharacterized protein n=1 Tax=Papaver somniferum TaxID=3469 RepID=A0A4Y7J081_PAPSO|nr:late embryogenesis abundant protein Lea5-like [Papaver somniferum]RZC53065.1 hypothetical protein C5167_011919 [Papaver somniferum]
MAARSFSKNAQLISSLIDGVSLSLNRSRGISSVATQAVGSRKSGMVVTGGEVKSKSPSAGSVSETSPWVPDPVTGYYRPESHADEIDVTELREMLLKQRQH